ncbi:methyl-accepting chemotaxis protein [Desulfoscipio sp. XC116]|uniref:methyl-accepting chemotaxis protein n=1 Tax=Desulfoscipio sp. XC116 TaxID=3144975 RepID=UPI00325BE62B
MKLNIKGKILFGFGIVILLLLGSCLYLIAEMKKMDDNYSALINEKAYGYVYAESARAEFNMSAVNVRGYIIDGNSDSPAKIQASLDKSIKLLDKIASLISTDEGERLINDYKAKADAYKKLMLDQLVPLVSARDLAQGEEEWAMADKNVMDFFAANQKTIDGLNTAANALSEYESTLLEEGGSKNTDDVNKIIMTSNIIVIITIILGLIIAFLIARMIANPVSLVDTEAAKIAAGDLTGEEIKVRTKDEVGHLAESFNNMLHNLKDVARQLQEKSHYVASSAAELSASAENVSAAATETASTVGEVASTVEQVAANAKHISDVSTQAAAHAKEGNEGLNSVVAQMDVIQKTTDSSGKVVSGLSESAGKITQIVELITSIADQTNLLALNAAIESARAGEHGRGFAVVADEVRKLAEQSAGAAKEIHSLITSIQYESQKAVESMQQSGAQVETGAQVVREVKVTIERIIGAVQSMADDIQSVAAAIEQMNSGVQNVAAATEEQTATMEEVASTTQSLAGLAGELDELSKRFKLV